MKLDPENPVGLTEAGDDGPPDSALERPKNRGRGRPVLMPVAVVIEKIRALGRRREGLFRVHHTHPGLYARARRQFGSWAAAVAAAGMDYGSTLSAARLRSIRARRRRRRSPREAASLPGPPDATG